MSQELIECFFSSDHPKCVTRLLRFLCRGSKKLQCEKENTRSAHFKVDNVTLMY